MQSNVCAGKLIDGIGPSELGYLCVIDDYRKTTALIPS